MHQCSANFKHYPKSHLFQPGLYMSPYFSWLVYCQAGMDWCKLTEFRLIRKWKQNISHYWHFLTDCFHACIESRESPASSLAEPLATLAASRRSLSTSIFSCTICTNNTPWTLTANGVLVRLKYGHGLSWLLKCPTTIPQICTVKKSEANNQHVGLKCFHWLYTKLWLKLYSVVPWLLVDRQTEIVMLTCMQRVT